MKIAEKTWTQRIEFLAAPSVCIYNILNLVKPQTIYAESNRKLHTVIRPRNHDNGQGDRYHGDDILSGIFFLGGGGVRIFDIIFSKPSSQLEKLLYSSIHFITMGSINDVSYRIMTLF